MLDKYFEYNDIICEHFFNPQRVEKATTLGFDETEAQAIAQADGREMDGPQFEAELIGAIREAYNRRDAVGWWTTRSARERVAILACSVLVMSKMPPDGDDHGFYARYRSEVFPDLRPERVIQQFAAQRQWWQDLEHYFNEEHAEALGRLVFPFTIEWPHQKYPASQCILRGKDRRSLHVFFAKLHPSQELTRERFLAQWRPTPQDTVALERAVKQMRVPGTVADVIWEIFEGEYEVWKQSPEARQRAEARRQRALGATAQRTLRGGLRLGVRSGESSGSPRARIRLVLQRGAPAPAPARYVLRVHATGPQLDDPFGSAPLADGWYRVPGVTLGTDEFLGGFDLEVDGLHLRSQPRYAAVFEETPSGLVSTDALPIGRRCVLLFADDNEQEVRAFVSENADDLAQLTLGDELEGLTALSITLRAVPPGDVPGALEHCVRRSGAELSVRSGLRLRDGTYLYGAPPVVTFNHESIEAAELLIDGQAQGELRRAVPFALPSTLEPGLHTVTILDRTREFRVADRNEENANQPDLMNDDDLGFITRLRPPLMGTSRDAMSMKTKELAAMNAVVIVGAGFYLPYDRKLG